MEGVNPGPAFRPNRLTFLTPREVYLIDRLLSSVGDFGEVRLTVRDGKLRFVSTTKSYDAFRFHLPEEQ